MNQRVKTELGILSALGALAAAGLGFKKTAVSIAGAGLVAQFLPDEAPYSFAGKSVVLTGGSRGLGLALAENLQREGARLFLIARDEQELERAKVLLLRYGRQPVNVLACDVCDAKQVEEALAKVGVVDVLINDAGAISVGPFASMEMVDFEAQMKTHFWGVMHTVRASLPALRKAGGGKIVNICSIAAKFPHPHMSPYIASKYAQSGLSKAITAELAPENIKVTTVYPGLMRTGSYIQAVFKGDHEREFSWFATSDLTPGLSMPADEAAKKIIEAVRGGQSEFVLGIPAKAGALLYSLLPNLVDAAMGLYMKMLPQGQNLARKTGAESQSLFNSRAWTSPLRAIGDRAQKDYNQAEKSDADFNMGMEVGKLIH